MSGVAIEVDVESPDLHLLVARFKSFRNKSQSGMRSVARMGAEELRKEIVNQASGRPGPEIVTGLYTMGFEVQEDTLFFANQWVVSVVNENGVQWRRLEYGFTGIDALGRHYDQPPFAHIRPAIEIASPKIQRRAEEELVEWWETA